MLYSLKLNEGLLCVGMTLTFLPIFSLAKSVYGCSLWISVPSSQRVTKESYISCRMLLDLFMIHITFSPIFQLSLDAIHKYLINEVFHQILFYYKCRHRIESLGVMPTTPISTMIFLQTTGYTHLQFSIF